jgi:transketolase
MTSTPLSIPSQLAGNPMQPLKYAVSARLKSGETLSLPDPKITRALVALMDMNAVLGGAASHYGGPAAFAEINSALYALVFHEAIKKNKKWSELFHLVNDAGHCENGLYALKANYGFAGLDFAKLKKFRSIESGLTGHGEAHLFPEGVWLSNGPLGSAFPQSQGLAMADALAGTDRVTITTISDGACMEGEAREAMAAVPGLAKIGKMAPFVLVISDNNTKLSGRIDKESFSMAPSFAALTALGWNVLNLEDGHNLQKCVEVIEQAIELARSQPTRPVAVHVKTIKGIGTKKTAESSSGGHGFPLKSPTEMPEFLKEVLEGSAVPAEFSTWIEELLVEEKAIKASAIKPATPEEKMQTGISAAMSRARKAGLPVVSITSDLPGSTGVAGFRKDFPLDSFDVGVAESNMISAAAGFSKAGYIPVVDTFAQFGVTKGALPLTMAMLSEAPMICVFSHTGFQDAADGASHQALSYFAMVSSIPHVDVYALSCSDEADALMTQAIEKFAADRKQGKTPPSTVFFLGRENFPKSYNSQVSYELHQSQIVYESTGAFEKTVSVIAAGSLIPQAMTAVKALEAQNVGVVVVNPSIINKPDLETLKRALSKSQGRVVMVDDHQMIGGMNQMLTFELVKAGVTLKPRFLAVKETFGRSAYNAVDLYRLHGIDADAIVRAALEL